MTVAPLPPAVELESKRILKLAAVAHRHLAELKGSASSMPNGAILLNTLGLQEARASSEIENIVTTEDELFKAQVGEAAIRIMTTHRLGFRLKPVLRTPIYWVFRCL